MAAIGRAMSGLRLICMVISFGFNAVKRDQPIVFSDFLFCMEGFIGIGFSFVGWESEAYLIAVLA